MSSLVLRRLRGTAGTMLTWSVGGGILGAIGGAAIWLGVRLVNGDAMHLPSLVLGMGLVGAIVGAVSGLAFALSLLVAERRRSFEELRAWRTGALGSASALAMGWLVSRDPTFAAICATLGFGAAATSLVVARRALVQGESALGFRRSALGGTATTGVSNVRRRTSNGAAER